MKWILVSLLIGTIMLIAVGLSEQFKEKFDFYQNLKLFLNQFKLNLSFKQEKVGEFLSKVHCKKQFKIFIEEYQIYLKNGEMNLNKIKVLDSEDISILNDIVKSIGHFDAKNEVEQLNSFLLTIDARLQVAEKNKTKLCPMIIKLSLLFAIGLAILLV